MQFLIKYKYYLLFIIPFILYGNTIKNGYSLDDNYVTNKCITTKGLSSTSKIFTSYYATYDDGRGFEYRPIVKLCYAIEHQFFGVNPHISHFINIILYAICLIILFKVLILIFTENKIQLILLTVFIFAFLPIHVEVVASLKNRDVLLCFIFSFLAFYNLHKGINLKNKLKIILGIILIITALLSKLDALTTLALFPIILFYKNKYTTKQNLTILISISVIFITYKLIQSSMLSNELLSKRNSYFFENPLFTNKSLLLRVLESFTSLGFYTKTFLYPFHFSCYYGMNAIPSFSILSTYSIFGILTILLSAFGIYKYYKTPNHPVFIGILFYLVTLSMFLNFAKPVPGIVGERFAFFASIGFSIILSYFLLKTFDYFKNKNLQITAILLLLILFSTLIIKRNKDWNSEKSLFEADLITNPNSVKLNILCANILISEVMKNANNLSPSQVAIKSSLAKNYLLKAHSIDPNYYKISNNLGFISMSIDNNPNEAINWFKKSLKTSASKYELTLNIGLCFAKQNLLDSADKYFIKAYAIDPKNQKLKSDLYKYYKSKNKEKKYHSIYP